MEILFLFLCYAHRHGLDGTADPRVSDLHWGSEVRAACERRGVVFYRLLIEQSNIENGFFLMCRSSHRSNFKLILIDAHGDAVFEEDSSSKSAATSNMEAIMYFTRFDTYNLHPTDHANSSSNSNMNNSSADQHLAAFSVLDGFASSKRRVPGPGHYLLCVQCTNLLGRTQFAISAVAAKNDLTMVRERFESS